MAAFSLSLEVAGAELKQFGNIQITRAVSGNGTSGVCTTQLTFTTPAPLYAYRAALVRLSGIGGIGDFYISNRSQSKGIVTVTCLDRMAFLDSPFPLSDFTTADDSIALSDVMQKIVLTCGFASWGMMANSSWQYPKSKLEGVTCLDILNNIASALCGVWWCTSTQNLQFVAYPYMVGGCRVEKHTAIDYGAEYSPAGVVVTTSDGTQYVRGSTNRYDTIVIDSDLAQKTTADEIYNRTNGKTMQSFVVDKGQISAPLDIPPIVSSIYFGQLDDEKGTHSIVANNIVCNVNSQGIFATFRYNEPSGDEIGLRGKITLALDGKARYGDYGNAVLSKYQGWLYKEEDEPKSDSKASDGT